MTYIQSSPFVGVGDGAGTQVPQTVFGFASQDSTPFSTPFTRQSSAQQRARSLLSDMFQNAHNMHYSSTDDDEEYSTSETEDEDGLSMDDLCLESQTDTSSISSQPIAIPTHTYFKAEDQKAALNKLNAKRKWWASQQQPGSLAEKAQPAQLAAQKQAVSHHKYHKQTHHARGNQTKQS